MSDLLKVNSVKKGFDKETFQPLLMIDLNFYVEALADNKAMLGEALYELIGRELSKAVQLKLDEGK